jgi:hypothetical protein
LAAIFLCEDPLVGMAGVGGRSTVPATGTIDSEQLKTYAAELQRRKRAETEPRSPEQQDLRTRAEAFISKHARSEYEHLMDLLKERAEKIRSETGTSPEIIVTESYIQLRHAG